MSAPFLDLNIAEDEKTSNLSYNGPVAGSWILSGIWL